MAAGSFAPLGPLQITQAEWDKGKVKAWGGASAVSHKPPAVDFSLDNGVAASGLDFAMPRSAAFAAA